VFFRKSDKLSMRLLFWILFLSSIFTVIATMIQIYTDYRDSRQSLEIYLDQVQESVLPSVAVAMWKLDKEVMHSILNGVLTQRDTIYVEVADTYANSVIELGQTSEENAFTRLYPIKFTDDGNRQIIIGQLKIVVTLTEIYRQLMGKALIILITQGVKTFLMSICILVLIDLLVIRHLNRLADWAYNVKLENPARLLILKRRKSAIKDVLDRVTSAINTMQQNLLKALAKRKQAERLIHSIVENSPSLIYSKDTNGNYTLVNQEFLTTHNLEYDQVLGHNDAELFSTSLATTYQKYDLEVIEQAKPVTFEQEMEKNDHLEYYLSVKFPIYDDNGLLVETGGISTNITDRIKKEQQILELNENLEHKVHQRTQELEVSLLNLQEAQSKLVESEKMSALGSLVAGISHEINTPLGIAVTASSHLSGIIKKFEQEYQSNQLKKSSLEALISCVQDSCVILMRNLERADELIQNFKQIAVDQSNEQIRSFELNIYLDKLIHSLKPQLNLNNHTIVVQSDHQINLISDPGAISQVLTNLIMNSIKHGFKAMNNGQITIIITLIKETVSIDYQDNGLGLDAKQREKVFEPFYTTARATGGSGLGMSISYNIVTVKLAGDINCIESSKGAHFKITFPATLSG